MFRAQTITKLGRWSTKKTVEQWMRAVDLANYDCSNTDQLPKPVKYHVYDDDIIDMGIVNIGSFDLHGEIK